MRTIKEIREELGMDRKEFANYLEISLEHLIQLEAKEIGVRCIK